MKTGSAPASRFSSPPSLRVGSGRYMVTTYTQTQRPTRENKAIHTSHRRKSFHTGLMRFSFLLPIILYLLIFYGYPLYYSISVSLQHYDLQAEYTGEAAFIG